MQEACYASSRFLLMLPRNSFPKICVALGLSDSQQLMEHARREIDAGETFLEIRLDYLSDPRQGIGVIHELTRERPEVSILATCRRHQNHGRFNGSIEDQIHLLSQAIDAGARAVDLEIESAELANGKLEILRSRSCFIVSYHNFESTPALDPIVRRLMKVAADAYKVVTTARKPSDVGRILELAKMHPRTPFILLAMGEQGIPSRILSPALGGLYTYAAPSNAEGTAAGQMSSRLLRSVYRLDKLSRTARIFGVIADPVRHSISPAVHNRAFQARRIDGVYVPFLTPAAQLRDFMTLAKQLPVAGFSVTIPHKQRIVRYLDVIDPLARRIGAVNTVWRKAGKWRGANTDAYGVLAPLQKRLRIAGSSVLIAGNGGAARAAACALADAGARVALVGRNMDRVRALARTCGATALNLQGALAQEFDVFIHATPLGMHPHIDQCFFPDRIPAAVVFDMVYNPLETLLLQRAREQGRETITGLEMFLEQAARQFEIWTGESAPRPAMERAACEALGQSMAVANGAR